ncbi:hypothetical protein BO71DRAFT_397735 [Aspergillus ellipticus CBS 707.79]|uniref:Uncharacterized protein n=1 Tax=Aspergillus ellipticus CBS 707.79 TaxID=1448320 RepID=A0A319DWJ0_9EURO|nr:hypothetical protein BO71DRAFT_397735 [Aspergillus ellipticus CBS 707.79]
MEGNGVEDINIKIQDLNIEDGDTIMEDADADIEDENVDTKDEDTDTEDEDINRKDKKINFLKVFRKYPDISFDEANINFPVHLVPRVSPNARDRVSACLTRAAEALIHERKVASLEKNKTLRLCDQDQLPYYPRHTRTLERLEADGRILQSELFLYPNWEAFKIFADEITPYFNAHYSSFREYLEARTICDRLFQETPFADWWENCFKKEMLKWERLWSRESCQYEVVVEQLCQLILRRVNSSERYVANLRRRAFPPSLETIF